MRKSTSESGAYRADVASMAWSHDNSSGGERRENLIYALALPGFTNFLVFLVAAPPKPALSATPLRRCVGGTNAVALTMRASSRLQRVASIVRQCSAARSVPARAERVKREIGVASTAVLTV